jgi:hypothetical protein
MKMKRSRSDLALGTFSGFVVLEIFYLFVVLGFVVKCQKKNNIQDFLIRNAVYEGNILYR